MTTASSSVSPDLFRLDGRLGPRRWRGQRHRRRDRRRTGDVRRRRDVRRRQRAVEAAAADRRPADRRARRARPPPTRSTCSMPSRRAGRGGELGPPDVLVTTPAINVRKRIVDYTDDDLDRVVDLNVKGVFRLCRAFGRGMADAGRGSMIGFSSIRAQTTEPGQGAYAATKAATVMLFRTLAAELGPSGVRANVIAPGVVETPLTAPITSDPAVVPRLRRQVDPAPLGAAVRARRRRRLPRLGRVELRHRHHAVRRRRLDGGRRALRPADLTPDATLARQTGQPSRRVRHVPIDADALVELTRALVRIPSVYDPARGLDEEPAAELVAEQMRAFGWDPEIDVVAPGRPNVIATIDGDRPGPHVAVRGPHRRRHRGRPGDVVVRSLRRRAARRPDPRARRGGHEGRRGGHAVRHRRSRAVRVVPRPRRRRRPRRRGGDDGRRQGLRRPRPPEGVDGAICCEPEGGEICHVAKGALRLRIDLTGVMAHGAMPFEGRNPNRAAGAVLTALAELEARLQQRHGEHPHLGLTWVTPTVLRAGEPAQMNVMPGAAGIWVDVRTIPAVDHDELVAEVRRARRRRRATRTASAPTVDVIDDRPAVEVAEGHPLVRALWDAHAAVGIGRAPARRRARRDRRHGAHVAWRHPDGRLRPGRQVDRPPGRRVRRGRRPRRARRGVRRGGAAGSSSASASVIAGPRNDLTDVAGVRVGHHHRRGRGWLTGTTVVIPPPGTTGGVDVRGGGPGHPRHPCARPDQHGRPRRRRLPVGRQRLRARRRRPASCAGWPSTASGSPSAPSRTTSCRSCRPPSCSTSAPAGASTAAPTPTFGYRAATAARVRAVTQGTVGVGTGTHAGRLKGGVGSASVVLDSGITVAALVAVNCSGDVFDPRTGELFGLEPRPAGRVRPGANAVARRRRRASRRAARARPA